MKKTLVIMAAGMGSRFGGLKQVEPVGPSGEFIVDYSIYDAMKAGFSKVVFIIKKQNEELFRETVGKRIENFIDVEYAFQELSDIPEGIVLPEEREKPLGTGHALYAARKVVHEPFALISADDFYGREPFYLLSEFLDHGDEYSIIGYHAGSTLTTNGSVKRGVCFGDDYLDSVIESKLERINGEIVMEPLDGSEKRVIEDDQPVAMSMYGIRPSVFPYLEHDLGPFLEQQEDLLKCEYLLTSVLDQMIHENKAKLRIIPTEAKWMGVTYKEDLEELKNTIQNYVDAGEYPESLWERK